MKPNRAEDRAYNTIRNLMAQGFTDAATLISTAADVIGGDDEAMRIAQAVWDKRFKIYGAN